MVFLKTQWVHSKKVSGDISENVTGDIPKKVAGYIKKHNWGYSKKVTGNIPKRDDHGESIKYLFSLFARSRRRRRMGREYDGKERGKWEGEVLTYLLGRLVFPFLDEPCVGAAV